MDQPPVATMAMVELGSNARSPAAARRFVADVLDGWRTDVNVEDAVLLTSELVTNAVRHSVVPLTVRLDRGEGRVCVEVCDWGPGVPIMGTVDDPLAPSGRGLAVVNAIAAAWGVKPIVDDQVTVWFVLAAPAQPS